MGQISAEDDPGAGLRGGRGDGAQVLPIRAGFGLIAPATTAPREGRASAVVKGSQPGQLLSCVQSGVGSSGGRWPGLCFPG